MIEVKKLVKTFDGFTALDSATLTVPKGAVYGLVGPNGAGKSTLLRHITGVYKQDSGQVLVNGVPVFENRHVKERIVSIPDDWFYYNQSTIREMAKLYAGMYPRFDGGRFEKLRELFHLPEKKPIRRMSKGMQRQAAFWITMSCLPEYLVLDEPVDGLDPVMRRQVWQVLNAFIVALASKWSVDEPIVISTSDAEGLKKYFTAQAKELLDKGVKIEQVNGNKTLFSVSPADGSYKVNFGEEEFMNYFKEFLRPQLVEMLF